MSLYTSHSCACVLVLQPVYNAHKLTCQYKRHHPLFYIDPLKEETMSFKPWLAVYHDVISEREMAVVKELAVPKVRFHVHDAMSYRVTYHVVCQ